MEKVYDHKIQYYETDKMQITHHSNYIRFMEEARMSFLDKHGYGYERMEREGVISPLVEIKCKYKKPTTFGDTIEIFVDTTDLTPVKLTISYIMKVNDEIVCTGESVHCFLSRDGKVLSLKKIYPELYEIFYQMIKKNEVA